MNPDIEAIDIIILCFNLFSVGFSIFAVITAKKAYDQAVKEQLAKRQRRI
ncbi:hypothetical protein [Cytobacillus praedii]|nr:hypothetical protein [Cytobacillus praedii]